MRVRTGKCEAASRRCEGTLRRSEGGQRGEEEDDDEDEVCSPKEDHNAPGCHRNRNKQHPVSLGHRRAPGRRSDRSQVD